PAPGGRAAPLPSACAQALASRFPGAREVLTLAARAPQPVDRAGSYRLATTGVPLLRIEAELPREASGAIRIGAATGASRLLARRRGESRVSARVEQSAVVYADDAAPYEVMLFATDGAQPGLVELVPLHAASAACACDLELPHGD